MDIISNNDEFKTALASLSLSQQRQIGAQFAMNVMDLTDGSCMAPTKIVAESPDVTLEELEDAYRVVHRYYSLTHLLCSSEMNYEIQAAHFVAQACMASLGPAYGEHHAHQLAEKIAGYCRFARTCSKIECDSMLPSMSDAESALKAEIEAQHRILHEFLEAT